MKRIITILLYLFSVNVYSQPVAPILQIETGMHTSGINKISTDALGKYILTCSDDKTARLWDAENGNLLNTFRIPIGFNEEGKIYACAISPDGAWVVLGGYPGGWNESALLYVVNTQSGKIEYALPGNDAALVTDIKFSPDSKWLAAGLGNGELRIYNSETGNLKVIPGTGYAVTCMVFDNKNWLATVSSEEKTVRLFEPTFELKAKIVLSYNPSTVSFNDDNRLLAISSYNDKEVIEIRSAKDLSLLYEPNATGYCSEGAIFGTDNKKLYSWGSKDEVPGCRGCGTSALRVWENYGQGEYKEIPFTYGYGINQIKSLPDNKMVLASSRDISVFSSNNTILWKQVANLNRYGLSSDYSHFRINNNGTVIGLTPDNETAFTFEILNRRLIPEQSQFPSYSDNNIIKVTSWNSRSESMPPYINEIPVAFLDGESTRAIDINSDGTEVIFAGWYALFKCDNKANLIWKSRLPYSPLGGINISGDDKMVACLLTDGTVRWFSMKDGKELLALFIDKIKKKWVLFTPSGYYDASPGAEEMLGWHLNNGPDKTPDFYPVSRFKEKYYRPDIIDAIFEIYNEEDAITLANSRSTKKIITGTNVIREKLPPTVIISSPTNGSNTSTNSVTINYAITSPGDAPAKNLRVLVDGRPVATERGLKPAASTTQKITVTIPSQDCVITLLAENDNGASPETNLYLKWVAPAVVKEEFIYKPKLYVLAIGVSDYNNPELKLGFAAKDASDFASAINKQKGSLYSDVIVKKLTNKEATKDAMIDGLEWIQKQTGQKDVAMIFYAGHGINDNNGVFYMLPVAADLERIRATCLNFEELKQTVSSIAGKVVVFIDACHSGNVMGSTRRGGNDINAVVNELSSTENGAITFTSSTGKEFSLEDPAWGNGAFTKAVIEGLGGKAAINGKNKITIKSLDAYISERVKELTKGKQHPTSVSPPNVPDFPIAVTQ